MGNFIIGNKSNEQLKLNESISTKEQYILQGVFAKFNEMNRNSRIYTAEECRKELEKYKKKNPKYRRINQKPGRVILSMMKLESEILYYFSYVKRIYPAIMRRLKKEM